MRKRNKAITVRLTEAEHAELLKLAEQTGKPMHVLLMHAIRQTPIATGEQTEELRRISSGMNDIYKQLRGIGTNINQMARTANSTQAVPEIAVLRGCRDEITETRKELAAVWDQVRKEMRE